jgi:hypothetical protein
MDRNGNQVGSLVQAYFPACPFSSHRDFPMSLCAQFQDGLDPCLQTSYHCYFPQHGAIQLLNTTHQQKTLQAMLQATQQAKDDLHAIQRVAWEAVGMSQAFHAGRTRGLPPTAGAFSSQAKKTLSRYSSDGGLLAASLPGARGNCGTQCSWTCFGCGGPHPSLKYHPNNGHVVICLNCNNPGVRENANKNIAKMRKERKKWHIQNTKRKNFGTANLSNFDNQGRQRITKKVYSP